MSEIIVSPCVSVCLLDLESDYCKGCYRTIDEIAGWGQMTHAERKAIMDKLDARKARHDDELAD